MNTDPPVVVLALDAGNSLAAAPSRSRRRVALKFWFGPFRLWTVRFDLEIEAWRADPFRDALLSAPDFDRLTAGVEGVYRPSEPLANDVPILTVSNAAIRYVESSFNRRFIDLATSFDAYMSKFSGKTRSTMRRKLRKFEEMSGGKIAWQGYRSPTEMIEFHDIAREISKRTYQEKLFDVGLPADEDFIARMKLLAEAGNVRGFILSLQGKPISYLHLPIEDGRVIYGHLGFDPAYAAHSPGTVLQLLALEQLFSEQLYRLFDFTEGDGDHKRLFATHARNCGNVFYLRPTLRNHTIVRLHFAARRLSAVLERQLARGNVKARLKQILRGQRSLS